MALPDYSPISRNLELFKSTFQKPSQIYRFLSERWKVNPIYLQRNLSYIRKHRRFKNGPRKRHIEPIMMELEARLLMNVNNHDVRSNRNVTNSVTNNKSNKTIAVTPANGGCNTRQSGSNKTTGASNASYSNGINSKSSCLNGIKIEDQNQLVQERKPRPQQTCYFNWICNDTIKQRTKTYGYICPWCDKDLHYLDSLMMHLECTHPRFNFNFREEDNEYIIDLTLNSSFDGSYQGFKYPGHDLKKDFRFSEDQPIRRIPATKIFFFRARKRSFMEHGVNSSNNNRFSRNQNTKSYYNSCTSSSNNNNNHYHNNQSNGSNGHYSGSGNHNHHHHHHNHHHQYHPSHKNSSKDANKTYYNHGEADTDCAGRLYYHTTTCLPVKPNELDLDSEADMDPAWLRERTQLMIDEFSDVNEGEKEILKMWNLHLMTNYQYKGDNMMRKACFEFVEKEGPQILAKNLYKNFTLHLANLFEFGLLGSGDVLQCVRNLRKIETQPQTQIQAQQQQHPTKAQQQQLQHHQNHQLNNGVISNSIKTSSCKSLKSSERNSNSNNNNNNNEHCQLSSPAKRALLNSHCN